MDESQIIEAIKRSGYLFESEIAEYLNKKDYFVESNLVVIDPITGKSRDIDLTFHRNDIKKNYDQKVFSMATMIVELKNNLHPVVLLTKYQFNPSSPDDFLREYVSPTRDNYQSFDSFYEPLVFGIPNIYTQYCSFIPKKGKPNELMAFHPDELYAGISKIVQYCDEKRPWWETDDDIESEEMDLTQDLSNTWFRHEVYIPIILLKNDLYELEIIENQPVLKKVKDGTMVFNYHHNKEARSSLVHFVTEEGLPSWLEKIKALELKSEDRLLTAKKSILSGSHP